MEGVEVRYRLRSAEELSDQEVPAGHHPASASREPEKEVEQEAAPDEEGLLPKILDCYRQVEGAAWQ